MARIRGRLLRFLSGRTRTRGIAFGKRCRLGLEGGLCRNEVMRKGQVDELQLIGCSNKFGKLGQFY